ncbi:alpha/beta hydrolase fold domain-containing protein [Microbacterium sp. X-17]|uniref:alpha/beta hydrolase fold domain-containing protein n=1 Tax=Microbacterium sp. X-17 TaxID=3144404 RepID=UPI0031F58DEF
MSRRRRRLDALERGLRIDDDIVSGGSNPIRIRRYTNPHAHKPGTLVWAHGGGFVHGDLEMPESHAVAAAVAQSGLSVVAVDYSLVPAWPKNRPFPDGSLSGVRYPRPAIDLEDVFRDVVARADGVVALGGASAGACLAATVAFRLVGAGATLPSDLVVVYGGFHASLPSPSPEVRAALRGPAGWFRFRPGTIARINRNYAGSEAAMHDAFPGDQALAGMPPTLIIDAERDSLRASGSLFASQLRAAGTDVGYRIVRGGFHGFLNVPGTRRFAQAIDLITDRLATRAEGARL